MAFSALTSDSFNRANGGLGTSTLDNAGGGSESNTWTDVAATWAVSSNQAVNTETGADRLCVVASTGAVADQRVSAKVFATDCGVVGRYTDATHFYMVYADPGSNKVKLYLMNGSFSLLGTGATTINAGDTITLECIGDAIKAKLNGTDEVSVTDATLASGKPGLYGGGNGTAALDDFLFETEAATTTRGMPFGARGTAFNGGRAFLGNIR